jgi:hypothetical protein
MLRVIDITEFSRYILRGKRLAIIISIITRNCKNTCPFKYIQVLNSSIENGVAELLKQVESNNEITCIISLCKINAIKNKNIALCSLSSDISKHRYDEALKCISFSDALIMITKDMKTEKLLANFLCIAQLEGIETVLLNISNNIT